MKRGDTETNQHLGEAEAEQDTEQLLARNRGGDDEGDDDDDGREAACTPAAQLRLGANIEAGREEDEVGASASDNQAGDSLNDPRHGSDIGAQSRSDNGKIEDTSDISEEQAYAVACLYALALGSGHKSSWARKKNADKSPSSENGEETGEETDEKHGLLMRTCRQLGLQDQTATAIEAMSIEGWDPANVEKYKSSLIDLISNSCSALETSPLVGESDDGDDESRMKQDHSRVIGALALWKLLLACVKDKSYIQSESSQKSRFWSKLRGKKSEKETGGDSQVREVDSWIPYDSRARVALKLFSLWIGLKESHIKGYELLLTNEDECQDVDEDVRNSLEREQSENDSKTSRKAKIALAATVGGGLLALTGGLIAVPALAAALTSAAATGTIGAGFLTTAAAMAGTATGAVVLTSAFGAAGAGLTGFKMAKRIGSLKEFEFEEVKDETTHITNRAAITVVVSGFVVEKDDFIEPWRPLAMHRGPVSVDEEVNSLIWESKELIALGTAMKRFLYNTAVTTAAREVIRGTLLSTFLAALAWPATIIQAAGAIDNIFHVVMNRAESAGVLLAKLLRDNIHGYRPVSLIGQGIGSRVVFYALEELAKTDSQGIIEDVIIMGAPCTSSSESWLKIRNIVAGKIVNVYASEDWFLGYVYRGLQLSSGVAGIEPILVPENFPEGAWIRNLELQKDIQVETGGHAAYNAHLQEILKQVMAH